MTAVKICGITNLEDAMHSAECGADAIGFNFYPGSERYISPKVAKSIVEQLLQPVLKVGVFVNASTNEITKAARIAHLEAVQLHGDETPDFIEALRSESDLMIIKAFRVGNGFAADDVMKYKADAILLDAVSAGQYGGTGKTVDLAFGAQVAGMIDKLYLAGGLSNHNVRDAIRAVKPFAVDACSCLESSAGKKDPDKVASFIEAAKTAL